MMSDQAQPISITEIVGHSRHAISKLLVSDVQRPR
jgi:hypothetical protein